MDMFGNRELLQVFNQRPVCGWSEGKINVKKEFILNVGIDFGINGKVQVHTVTPAFNGDPQESWKFIGDHARAVNDVISGFEDYLSWLENVDSPLFNKVIYFHKPYLFHGTRTGKKVLFGLYGPGLYDLEFILKTNEPNSKAGFVNKLEAMIEVFREHLYSIERVKVKELLSYTR